MTGDHYHTDPPSDEALRVKALESLLVDKGLINPDAVDAIIEQFETQIGPHNGAKVVARAWVDSAYRARLIDDAWPALQELDVGGVEASEVVVLENTEDVHNLVVCTLCSCYPWALLGLPPSWYKSPAYRSRAVKDPRALLAEFGLKIPTEREVRVWDSNADIRYLVLPERPAGTEDLSENDLAALVTRDAMVGIGLVSPSGD
jgi:nitrile hydratase